MEVTMSKQTAVDWLEQAYWDNKGTLSQKHFDQAKQMEKEQMKEAALDNVTTNEKLRKIFEIQFEDFYNETYGGNNSEITMNNQSSTFPYVCASCNKEMVAGGFPKWFCLHTTCKNYLKPITK